MTLPRHLFWEIKFNLSENILIFFSSKTTRIELKFRFRHRVIEIFVWSLSFYSTTQCIGLQYKKNLNIKWPKLDSVLINFRKKNNQSVLTNWYLYFLKKMISLLGCASETMWVEERDGRGRILIHSLYIPNQERRISKLYTWSFSWHNIVSLSLLSDKKIRSEWTSQATPVWARFTSSPFPFL